MEGFQGADAHPRNVTHPIFREVSGQPGGHEINRPAIEIEAINKVAFVLGGFAKVFAGRVIGVTNRTVTVLAVNTVLAPDISLDSNNPMLFPGIANIIRREESAN